MAAIQQDYQDTSLTSDSRPSNEGAAAAFSCRQRSDLDCAESRGTATARKWSCDHFKSPAEKLQEKGPRRFSAPAPPPCRCACSGGGSVQMFCRDCRRLACDDCIAAEHAGHSHDPAKKCASQSRRLLQQSLFPLRITGQQLTESLARIKTAHQDVSSQTEDAERSIQLFFDETISLLEQERQNILARTAKLAGEKLKNLREQEQKVRRASGEVQSVVDYCRQKAEMVSDEEFLALQDDLQNRIREECSRHDGHSEQDPCEVANIAVQMTGAEEIAGLCREKARVYLFPSNNNSHVHRAKVGEETTHCIMESSDPLFTPHLASFTASVVSVVDGSTIEGSVTPVGRGLYEVCYTPTVRGRHRLWVKRDGEAIPGAPFPVLATISPTQLGKPVHCMESLKHPYSAAFDSQNQLFVTQSGGETIQKYRRSGDDVVSESFEISRQLKAPTGMAVDSEGFSYLVNISTHTLCKFDSSGALVGEVGKEGSDRDELNHPSGVAVVGNKVFVCDRNNDRIKIYSRDLKLLGTFGSHGCGEGEMNWPYDVTCDDDELVYVADSDNHRVQVFNKSGKFQHSLGTRGNGEGSLMRPTGVCMGHDGLLYVTEYANHHVSVFQRDGTFVGGFGSYGSAPGQFCYPVGITVDGDGFVYVCDQGNNRVQVF